MDRSRSSPYRGGEIMTDAPVMTCGSVGLECRDVRDLFDNEEPSSYRSNAIWRCCAQRVRSGTLDLVGVGRMHIANNDFVNQGTRGALRRVALFNKTVHLAEAWRSGARFRRGVPP